MLDVGCGTGAITAGIAVAVAPHGRAVGLERDPVLLSIARERHRNVPGLSFRADDVLTMQVEAEFDIVTAARTLQWIGDPGLALRQMKTAVKPGGLVVALDYSHARLIWEPAPPFSVRRFYAAFLAWRSANGWDNLIADRLPELFAAVGLEQIVVQVEDETASRGEPGFDEALATWHHVIRDTGPLMAAGNFLSQAQCADALDGYARWRRNDAQRQVMFLRAVEGRS